jgi:hypothetical protein
MKQGLTAGAAIALAAGESAPWAIGVDSSNVYWISTGENSLKKVSINGGPAIRIADANSQYTSVAVDGDSVYWVDLSGSGAIKKVTPK